MELIYVPESPDGKYLSEFVLALAGSGERKIPVEARGRRPCAVPALTAQ